MTPQQAKLLGFKQDRYEKYWYNEETYIASCTDKALKKLTVKKFLSEIKDHWYKKGWDAKAEEIRKVLELD